MIGLVEPGLFGLQCCVGDADFDGGMDEDATGGERDAGNIFRIAG